MNEVRAAVSSVALLIMLCGCGGRDERAAVPRPKAYPRAVVYDSAFVKAAGVPLNFEVNASADAAVVRHAADGVWLDVAYPAYGGVMHVTFTRAGNQAGTAAAVANRRERMMLNLGDNMAESVDLTSVGGFEASVLVSRSAALMPVQFLSVGRDGWVVSGAFVFGNAPLSADSIRPVVRAVAADVVHAMKMLE